MNWHETIEYIRTQNEYKDLVRDTYIEADLELNIQNFGKSEEFIETLNFIKKYMPDCQNILDVGAGNGISAVNFALQGYNVTAIEPDPSPSVGANAILSMKNSFNIPNLQVIQNYAENIEFKDETFDLVYARQAMHHANNLNQFVSEASRVLKKGGILFTVRDHVIFDKKDKELFLNMHPLQKFYGGENAFSSHEYKQAMENANLIILEEIKFFDNILNYFPRSSSSIKLLPETINESLKNSLKQKLGILADISFIFTLYKMKNGYIFEQDYYNERNFPGRLYSFIAKKI